MEDVKMGKAGSALSSLAGVLLLLVWLAGMSLDDDRLCSSAPLCFGMAAALVLGIAAMLAGLRPAKPTPTCLFGLAAGLYFLIRCVAGDMLSEIWRELPLILAGFAFYGAGYLLAQRRGGAALTLALVLGVAVNVAYLILIAQEMIPVEAKGRPTMGLCGPNGLGCAFFYYENFAGMFLMMAGCVLICRPVWAGWKGWGSFAAALVGMVGVACSGLCNARCVLGLAPLMLVSAWVIWAIIRLHSGKDAGYGLVLSGIALFVGVVVLLAELFMGSTLLQEINAVDTHGRTDFWAELISILPEVPWCGHGAGASTWYLVPITTCYALPNYAHNDYLQAWVDYGIVGVGLVVAVVLAHLAAGFWSLASEDVGSERKSLVASCMLLLLAFMGGAVFDFVWHNVALAGVTAFACGVLASPVPNRGDSFFHRRKWAAGYRPSLRPVRSVGRLGVVFCCMGCLSLAALCAAFACQLLPGWKAQWEYNALWHAGASEAQRAAFLERVMPTYPDPELVDHYVSLTLPYSYRETLNRKEALMRMALRSNPHQLCTVVMLADVLSRQGRYAEAEALMRDKYLSDGQPGSAFANWPGHYGMNLLCWGRQRMLMGEHGIALSMMEYALRLSEHANRFRVRSAMSYRERVARNKATAAFVEARQTDVSMLRALGVEKDDSWMKPMRPGGQPALYARWGKDEADAEAAADGAPSANHAP